MNDNAHPVIFLLSGREDRDCPLAAHLNLHGFHAEVFNRRSSLLAAMHGHPPFALVLDEALQGELAIADVLPMVNRLAPESLKICLTYPVPVQRQIELVRLGVTDFCFLPVDLDQLIARFDRKQEQHQSSPIRVLVIDDSSSTRRLASTLLTGAGMLVECLANPLDVFKVLERFRPEIILLDMYMPECSGDEIARIIRQNSRYDGIPVVFLSTETSIDKQLFARSKGGDDFLVKAEMMDKLVPAVTITAERYRQLRHWMTRDSLTGLLNHTNLMRRLDEEMVNATRQSQLLAFAMIDIDHFKHVNDTYGHATGDRVIRAVSRLLRQVIGNADLVGRYGGEEFAVILPGMTLIRAAQKLDDLRAAFELLAMHSEDGYFRCTLSAGVAALREGMSVKTLVEAADHALYEAKQAGRNQIGLARS